MFRAIRSCERRGRTSSNTVVREEKANLSKLSTRRDTATHLKCLEQYGRARGGAEPQLTFLTERYSKAPEMFRAIRSARGGAEPQ
ncbi:hypothetical protein J6590_080838 [Homalodisca vitripennis]|nr:hypothetical protein J6590_080838 [Homalodisca vitripennis]